GRLGRGAARRGQEEQGEEERAHRRVGMVWSGRSVGGEAVEEAVAAGALEVGLAATARAMRRVPGGRVFAPALAVVVAHLGAARAVARPVGARVVVAIVESRAVELRAGQDVVAVGRVAAAVDDL